MNEEKDDYPEANNLSREPIQQIQENIRDSLKSFIPDGMNIGVAVKNGDCFFDSIAQRLNELREKGLISHSKRFSVTSLRYDCADEAEKVFQEERTKSTIDIKDRFFKTIGKYSQDAFDDCGGYAVYSKDSDGQETETIDTVKTFYNYKKLIKEKGKIWGKDEVEGRLLCSRYKIKLYFYSIDESTCKIQLNIYSDLYLDPDIRLQDVEDASSRLDKFSLDQVEKDVLLLNHKKHFVPLLSNLEADITKGVKVSREEVYGVENKESSSLVEDIENNDRHISEQAEDSLSIHDTNSNINTEYQYNDHMILKVWDNFIGKKGLNFYIARNRDDGDEGYKSSLFHGIHKMNSDIKAGLLLDNRREIYRNSNSYSVSMCQAVDYIDNSGATGENSISSSVKDALNQINLWNQQHQNQITKHKIFFPYHIGPVHWVLGVITLEYEQGVLKDSQLEIYDPTGVASILENVNSKLEKVLNDNGGHIELRFIDKSKKQQNDGTSCGAITAENGKDIIEGKSDRLEKTYKSGAYELRKQHVEEVGNDRFTEIQRNNEAYATDRQKIFDNIDDIANNFRSFLNSLSDEDSNRFKNVLEKLKWDNPGDSAKRSISEIFSEYKDSLKASKVFDCFFSVGSQELKWKENAYDNLEHLVKKKNLFDSSNEQLPVQSEGAKDTEKEDNSLNDLEKKIEGYLGESFHFANIFAGSKEIYLGYYNNQNSIEERSLKFAVLTNEKDSQNKKEQIVRCYTISHMENSPGSRFSEEERVLVKNALPSNQLFAYKEHKMFIRKDGGLVCKPFSEKRKFPKNVKGQCNKFTALNVLFSPVRASTPITGRNIPRRYDKAYAYKFLENLLKVDISPDVLVDIVVDSKDDTKITVVGRPKVLGSSRKQMRHVISYSSVKSAIESVIKVGSDYESYLEDMVEQVMIPLMISREGLCLTGEQYNNLKEKEVIPSGKYDEFKLTTKTREGQHNKYHLIYDKEIIETINKEKTFTEEEIKKARTDFNARLRKYISHGIDYLTDGLAVEDMNTVTIMCEGVVRIMLTMFNQDIHAAFPDEGNSLLEEIRLYKSKEIVEEARTIELQEQIKQGLFKVRIHDEITKEINDKNIKDYDSRIRIVNNEGNIVKRTAFALSVLDSLLGVTNINAKKSKKYLDDYNEKCNFTIRAHSKDLGNYNEEINKNNLNNVLCNHVAKHLYAVFDFKPLEKRVLAKKDKEGEKTIAVYPSSSGAEIEMYSIQEGNEYRAPQVRYAKGYNNRAIFRSQMTNEQIGDVLSSKIITHVIIHLVPHARLMEGFVENEIEEEGLGNGTQKILNSFISLIQRDYIGAKFHKGIEAVLNDDWVKQIFEKYQEQNKSFLDASSLVVEGSDIEEQPEKERQVGGSVTEESLKDIYIYKGGYMKKRKSISQIAWKSSHSGFLCDAMNDNDHYLITEWVENNLMKGDDQIRGGQVSRTAFYEAEKSLIRKYIREGQFNSIGALLDAIHNEKFKSKDSYKELKIKECEVLTGAIVMARGSLERDDTMHKNLNDLLKDKREELKKMEGIDLEKDGLSTRITEALTIVQVNSAGSSKGK